MRKVFSISRLVELWFVWGWYFFVLDGLPVDAFEPRVFSDFKPVFFAATQTGLRILV